MDRRLFLSSSFVAAAAAVTADAKTQPNPSNAKSLIHNLKNLEGWSKTMREQIETADKHCGEGESPMLHADVVPSISRWFGEIIAELASLEQYRPSTPKA